MRRVLDARRATCPRGRESNPFLRYRALLHSYHVAASRGVADADYVSLVQGLDREILRIDGAGFIVTPFNACDRLGARLGLAQGHLWAKDETNNVSGSHKARHLMGLMLSLQVIDAVSLGKTEFARPGELARPGLAIASCGNAALAAAVLARAAGRALDVFVPTWADAPVVARLRALGAHLTVCPREPGVAGDPCYRRFREVVRGGAIPFCCQGPDNGLTIEGGSTLVWEVIDALGNRQLDRIFVQVGGGALASACAQGYADAVQLGRSPRAPRLHTVQTRGGFPLKRAYDRLLARIVGRLQRGAGHDVSRAGGGSGDLADLVLAHVHSPILREELHYAATHRSEFMWPWETEPKSVATGILDDETYDWLAVVEGMLLTGGYPIVVDEDELERANALARETTSVNVDHTGTAGLAGLVQVLTADDRMRDETLAVIFTGVRRSM
jgi:threonine synthase